MLSRIAAQKDAEHASQAALESVARLKASRAAGFAWAPKAAGADDLILATGIRLEPNGYLTEESRKVASHVKISHEAINTIEDEKEIQAQLRSSNAMYAYAQLPLCNCRKCRKFWAKTARKESGSPLATTDSHPS